MKVLDVRMAKVCKASFRGGPFEAGTLITMTPPGEDPILLLIAETVKDELFVDEAGQARPGLDQSSPHQTWNRRGSG